MAIEEGLELTQSFLIVAQELNFRRSAERLNIDQSALTRRIQKLEQILGFALFERTTRDVFLTPAGRSFLNSNTALLNNYAESVRSARSVAEGKSGLLRVAYMAFAAIRLMPIAVSRYREKNPHVEVALQYIRTEGQKLALMRQEIDVGFMIGPVRHPDLSSRVIAQEKLCLVVPKDHRLARRKNVTPAEVAQENLILGDMNEWDAYRWRLNQLFADERLGMNVRLEASNTLALVGLVAAGLGVTIYPHSLARILGQDLKVCPIDHPAFTTETVLTWNRSNRSRLVSDFINVAKRYV